ncbi:hypothetical protein NMG60_11005397 [Bertholletia excelsa]
MSNCKCGSGCRVNDLSDLSLFPCKIYPNISYSGKTVSETLFVGVAPQRIYYEGSEMGVGAENGACNCRDHCNCNLCNCSK